MGHIVCKHGLLVDPVKIVLILSFQPLINVDMLRETLGHTEYYRKFIRGCVVITALMEKLLRKDVAFVCSPECQGIFNTMKDKMDLTLILVFPYWNKEFHVHVDESFVALGMVLAQPGEGDIDHSISFTSWKLSFAKKYYTTIEREGLVMVYALQKFRHYLLGGHFKMFTNHSALKHLVNKPLLGGKICPWLLLF